MHINLSEFFLFFIGLFRRKKSKNFFSILSILFSFFPLLLFTVSTFIFLLIIENLCERTNYLDFYYHAQLWNNVSNLNIYVVNSKKYENNFAPSWVRTRELVVRRLERRPLTCEIIATALRLLVTWPTAWDAPFSYEFYFEKPCCCWWNWFPTVKKQICFSKCRFYIAQPSVLLNDFIQ